MWEIIGTALLSGSAGFVAGAYWIVRYKPGPGIDLDEEDHREQWDELRDYCSQDVMLTRDIDKEVRREVSTTPNAAVGSPVTHLVRGGHTECCGVRTTALRWGELVTVDPKAVTCKEVWW